MRMLVTASLPHHTFNAAVKNGTVGEKIRPSGVPPHRRSETSHIWLQSPTPTLLPRHRARFRKISIPTHVVRLGAEEFEVLPKQAAAPATITEHGIAIQKAPKAAEGYPRSEEAKAMSDSCCDSSSSNRR